MTFLITFACVVLVSCLLRNVIRKVPWVLYIIATALVVLFFVSSSGAASMPREVDLALLYLMRRGFLANALFIFVMYIGIFPRGSKTRKFLQPLRAPLSITACILVLGHMIQYFILYVPRVFGGSTVPTNVLISFCIAVILFILALVLGATSFTFVKRHMKGSTWKRVQWFSYIFYAAIFAHLFIMLAPSAFNGGLNAIISMAIYGSLFVIYVVARVVRHQVEKRMGLKAADLSKSQAEVEKIENEIVAE